MKTTFFPPEFCPFFVAFREFASHYGFFIFLVTCAFFYRRALYDRNNFFSNLFRLAFLGGLLRFRRE